MNEDSRPKDRAVARLIDEHIRNAEASDSFRRELLIRTEGVVTARRRCGWSFGFVRALSGSAALVAVVVLSLYLTHSPIVGRYLRIHSAQVAVTPIQSAPANQLLAVTMVRGRVTDGAGSPLTVGCRVASGSMVRTGSDGRVTLVTHRGSLLSMGSNSEFTLDTRGNAVVRSGRIYCSNRQHEIRDIATPGGHINLLGTVLDAAVLKRDSVAVTVVEGKVRLVNSHGEQVVEAGRRALLRASESPEDGIPVNIASQTAWYDGRDRVVSSSGWIAYSMTRGRPWMTEIWAMRADGSDKHLVRIYPQRMCPVVSWWPGSEWLVVNVHPYIGGWGNPVSSALSRTEIGRGLNPLNGSEFWLLNIETGQDMRLEAPVGIESLHVSISPNGRFLAMSGRSEDILNVPSPQLGTWVRDLRTGDVRKMLDYSNPGFEAPAWSSDSRYLTGSEMRFETGHSVISVVDIEDGSIVRTGIQGQSPTISPDGTRVAYCGRVPGAPRLSSDRAGLYVLDLRPGAKPRMVARRDTGAGRIGWSPDGSRLVYATRLNPEHLRDEAYVVRADGSGEHRIYSGDERLREVAWSKDGSSIYARVERAMPDPNPEFPDWKRFEQSLLVIPANGSGEITNLGGGAEDCALTPQTRSQIEGARRSMETAQSLFTQAGEDLAYGHPAAARRCYSLVRDLCSETPWRYPLADMSASLLNAFADTAAVLASMSDAEMLEVCCTERTGSIQRMLQTLPDDLRRARNRRSSDLPTSLASLKDWLEHKQVVFRMSDNGAPIPSGITLLQCPGRRSPNPRSYVFHMPANDRPKEGDILISCPNHPRHAVTWDKPMLRMLRYFRE